MPGVGLKPPWTARADALGGQQQDRAEQERGEEEPRSVQTGGPAAQQRAVRPEAAGGGDHPQVAGREGRPARDQQEHARAGDEQPGDPAGAEPYAARPLEDRHQNGGRRHDHAHVGGGGGDAGLVDEGVVDGHAEQGGEEHEAEVTPDQRAAARPPGAEGGDDREGHHPAPERVLDGRHAVAEGPGGDEAPGPDERGEHGEPDAEGDGAVGVAAGVRAGVVLVRGRLRPRRSFRQGDDCGVPTVAAPDPSGPSNLFDLFFEGELKGVAGAAPFARGASCPAAVAPNASAMPASCTGVSAWPSAAQPTTAAVSGESGPRKVAWGAVSRPMPRNQSQYATAVLASAR